MSELECKAPSLFAGPDQDQVFFGKIFCDESSTYQVIISGSPCSELPRSAVNDRLFRQIKGEQCRPVVVIADDRCRGSCFAQRFGGEATDFHREGFMTGDSMERNPDGTRSR